MTVGRICNRDLQLAEPAESVAAAAARMRDRNVGCLVVLDGQRRPVGLLTDRDLTLRVLAQARDARATRVAEVMTRDPRGVGEATPIEDALAEMRRLGVRRLLVLAEGGELLGLVSIDDVLALLVEEFRDLGRILEESTPSPEPAAGA